MAFKHGDQTLITLDAGGATQLQSATGKDIVIYPADNVWIKEGTKLVFEGTVPDSRGYRAARAVASPDI